MTQRFSFWEDLSIAENLDFVARMYGVKNRREAVQRSLEQLGLAGRQKQLAGELSGGWKQRMALAACLIHQPKLLLLDEPTPGLGIDARRRFVEEKQLGLVNQTGGQGHALLPSAGKLSRQLFFTTGKPKLLDAFLHGFLPVLHAVHARDEIE